MAGNEVKRLFRTLIEQYQRDTIGRQYQHWLDLPANDDFAALRTIFLEGACFDFAAALSELTNWPVYEIQWGTPMQDDPTELDCSDYNIHRVVQHPDGRYLDASGWTDMRGVLSRVGRLGAAYQWMGEADPNTGPFDVDFELVKETVIRLLPNDIDLCQVKKPASGVSLGM